MKKSTREKYTALNEWLSQEPDEKMESEDIASIIEQEPMSWEELQAIRGKLGFEQTEMAKILYVKLSTYQKWEANPKKSDSAVNIPLSMARIVKLFYTVPALTLTALKKLKKI